MATNQEELGKSPCMKGIIHTTPQYTGKARGALQNSLVWCLLGLQFNEIQPFKISIFTKKYINVRDKLSGNPYQTYNHKKVIHSFVNFHFLSGCIFYNICPINPKLGDFVKLKVFFLTIWILCWLSHNIRARTQSSSVWKLALLS